MASTDPAFTLTIEQMRALVREEVEVAMRAKRDAEATLDCREAAKILRVHPKVVARWARTRVLPGKKTGGVWRFSRDAVLRWLREEAA